MLESPATTSVENVASCARAGWVAANNTNAVKQRILVAAVRPLFASFLKGLKEQVEL